ncbi:unnamed protein product [Effrenium voratum]|nr:unnamed protein product [Effrenium voratum]
MPCFVQGVYYHHPAMMAGELETYQPSPEACQVECKKEPRCLHFTYWPDGGCLLTTSVSTLKASGLGYSDALSGPKDCDDLVHFQREFHTGTVFCDEHPIWEGATASHAVCRRRCNNNENCAWYSYWHSGGEHWCRLTQHCQTMSEQPEHSISVYQKVTPELPEARPKLLNKQIRNQTAGVNGTKCKSYPACEALNVTKGTCCPNNNGIFLSCCSATVEKAKEALKAALNHTADPTPQPGMLRILPPPPPAVPAVPPV